MRKLSQKQIKNRTDCKWIIFIAVFLFFMNSCGRETPKTILPTKMQSAAIGKKQDSKQKIDEIKDIEKKENEIKEEKEYTYNATGKQDPFKPFFQRTSMSKGSRGGPLTPLQKYDLTQLKLVAIILSSNGNVALIEDATGKGYILKKGSLVGKNDGKVINIFKDKIVIEEIYQDFLGQPKTNEFLMLLQKSEEGGES